MNLRKGKNFSAHKWIPKQTNKKNLHQNKNQFTY